MWSSGWCGGSLRQKVCAIVNVSHGYGGGKVLPFDPPLLRDFAVECGGGRSDGGIASLSTMVNRFKRGLSSTTRLSCASSGNGNDNGGGVNNKKKSIIGEAIGSDMSYAEAKKLMRLVNVESLKVKLGKEGKEIIPYSEVLEACESMGVARNQEEAIAYAKVLDDAGVILIFRDKVYLHPDKVVDLVRRAVPLALTAENDPIRDELKKLQDKKEEIDVLAHKQVRRVLWSGLGFGIGTIALYFRLTFWEFSWDVMEPITFFTTSTGLVIGYAYFLYTSRDPTYQDFMKRLFLSRQRKLHKRYNFDVERYKALQSKCRSPLDASTILKNRYGVELDLEDALHRD